MFTSQMLLASPVASGAGGADNRITLPASAQAVLSVARAVDTSYSGNLIRVRRSSDGTESDIGFDNDGNLDQAALLAFTGSSTGNHGYITTVYDQLTLDNNSDFIQTTTSLQPLIVEDGVVKTQNGVPSAYKDLATKYFTFPNWDGNSTANTILTASTFSDADRSSLQVMYGTASSQYYIGVLQSGNSGKPDQNVGTPAYYKNGTLLTATRDQLYQDLMNQGFSITRVQDLSLVNSDFAYLRTDYPGSACGPTFWSEAIIFDDTHSAGDVTTVEDNQTLAFGIS